ncbi:hypothetical protein BKA62DRAFT_418551 [Auriculariales sp. MPI-PUGE-AT-0066]|nr:hypothetical protein BKA62DRAFT_418551 [Auriculariales sp. MPI-PUGE-AT-0066]
MRWMLHCASRLCVWAWNLVAGRRSGVASSGYRDTRNTSGDADVTPTWWSLGAFQRRAVTPYDGATITKGRELLCDAHVLSWMIQNLLTDADVEVAVEAIGACDREQHESCFQRGNIHFVKPPLRKLFSRNSSN